MLAEALAKARATAAAAQSQSSQAGPSSSPSLPYALKSGIRPTPATDPNLVAQMAARQREENARARAALHEPPPLPTPENISQEPPLRVGEAPSLATHPHTIAQMIARKRAEAEAQGHRERWARRQKEYQSSPGGARTDPDPDHDVGLIDALKTKARTASNPLPARSNPTIPPLKAPTPIVFIAEVPAARNRPAPINEERSGERTTASKPASRVVTQTSAGGGSANKEPELSNDGDSLFGSPFSSPIVEFLEKATDNAGLRDAPDLNQGGPSKPSSDPTTASAARPGEHRSAPTSSSKDRNDRGQASQEIPPLFSENPSKQQPQRYLTDRNQRHFESDSAKPLMAQTALAQLQQGVGQRQLSTVQASAPTVVSYYPQQTSMSGYYPGELVHDWSSVGSNYNHPPSTVSTSTAYPPALPPTGMSYGGYAMGNMNPYAMPPPALAPPPGQLPTYGNPTAGMTSTNRQKEPARNGGGYMSAADLVAGVNIKFKHATKNGFNVPKR